MEEQLLNNDYSVADSKSRLYFVKQKTFFVNM